MASLESIMDSIREDWSNDNVDRLISECEFEEDLMNLDNPRTFGPDADEDLE